MISRFHINSIEDIRSRIHFDQPIICLFSGGLDGTYLLYLLNKFGYKNILALTIDVGQIISNEYVCKIPNTLNVKWECIDAKLEFIDNFIVPSIYSNAMYLGGHPISASLSRPLMAKKAVQLAVERDYTCILHTSNLSQNSLRRFNTSIKLLGYTGSFGSPFAVSNLSRSSKIMELNKIGISWIEDKHYSVDENLWIHEVEYGDIDNPENFSIPDTILKWTIRSTSEPSELTVRFEQGKPVALNGILLDTFELIRRLNILVGSYGIGRYVWLEELFDGQKVQEVREAPAAFVLFDAYRRLESGILSAEEIREKLHIEQLWVREASEGRWFGKLRKACQSFIYELAVNVTGEIRYILSNEGISLNYMKAKCPLYIPDRQDYEINANEIN
jgi:argininosuccinate synthase